MRCAAIRFPASPGCNPPEAFVDTKEKALAPYTVANMEGRVHITYTGDEKINAFNP
jgi:hypothetical protein